MNCPIIHSRWLDSQMKPKSVSECIENALVYLWCAYLLGVLWVVFTGFALACGVILAEMFHPSYQWAEMFLYSGTLGFIGVVVMWGMR